MSSHDVESDYTGVCRRCGGFDQPRDYCRNCGASMSRLPVESDHLQVHRPHDGASECSCGQWVGPMTTLPLSDPRSFAAHIAAGAWSEGAHAAIELHNTGTRMTLRARVPFPADENPYVRSPSGETA